MASSSSSSSSPKDLQLHLITFNCGRAPVHATYFASSLFSSLSSSLPPDLIVFSLQEIAPIAESFLGGETLAPYLAKVEDAVRHATERRYAGEAGYTCVAKKNIGMTGLMVFAHAAVKARMAGWMQEAGVGVGVWEMGNKGAVGVRVAIGGGEDEMETVLTFVAAHLAPHEEGCHSRNADWKRICEGLVFERVGGGDADDGAAAAAAAREEHEPLLTDAAGDDGNSIRSTAGLFTSASHVFFAGDLNYRTSDHKPQPQDFETWPQPMSPQDDPSHFSHLLEHDQLMREMQKGRTLHGLAEAPIDFPPTYKYSDQAQRLAEEYAERANVTGKLVNSDLSGVDSNQMTEQVWLWAKHRTPSWCDRILYLAAAPPTIHSYTTLPVQPTSDHRPVVLSCSVPRGALRNPARPPFPISPGWRERRATARTLEYFVGLAAFLALNGQGQLLLGGTLLGLVAGYFVLSALFAST